MTATWEDPQYTVNAESLCQSDPLGKRPHLDPILGVIGLVDHLAEENFHLEPICRVCEGWKPASKQQRPGRKAAVDPASTCFGCHFGHLDGVQGGDGQFINHDKNAAFSAWANAKADVRQLELKRAAATGSAKLGFERRLEKAHDRVASAAKRCQRLGFKPTLPTMGQGGWVRPLTPETHDENRKRREREAYEADKPKTKAERREAALIERMVASPSCRNCRNWNEDLTNMRGHYGACWVTDSITRASYWCGDHNPKEDARA